VAEIRVGSNVFLLPVAGTARGDREAKDSRQAAYMAWIIQPKDEREPRTKTEVAKLLGVTVQTLGNYERDPDFAAAVRERLSHHFKVDRLPDLFESLYATATDSTNPRQVTAARTLLEWFGRAAGEQSAGALGEMSLEELAQAASAGA
jgi:hypothetical protein